MLLVKIRNQRPFLYGASSTYSLLSNFSFADSRRFRSDDTLLLLLYYWLIIFVSSPCSFCFFLVLFFFCVWNYFLTTRGSRQLGFAAPVLARGLAFVQPTALSPAASRIRWADDGVRCEIESYYKNELWQTCIFIACLCNIIFEPLTWTSLSCVIESWDFVGKKQKVLDRKS